MASSSTATTQLPCSIALRVPLPTARLASTALQALRVDPELSHLVQRQFYVSSDQDTVLNVDYQATTNRMLRVAVNSFMESLKLVLEVMEQLDVDILSQTENGKPS